MSTTIISPKKSIAGLAVGCKSTHFEVYQIVLFFVPGHRKSEIGPHSQQKWLLTSKQTSGTLCLVFWNVSVTKNFFTHFTIWRARSSTSKNEVKIGYLRGFYTIYKNHKGVSILSWLCCSGLVRGVYNDYFPKKVGWWSRNWLQIDPFRGISNSPSFCLST